MILAKRGNTWWRLSLRPKQKTASNCLGKRLHLRCLTGIWIRLPSRYSKHPDTHFPRCFPNIFPLSFSLPNKQTPDSNFFKVNEVANTYSTLSRSATFSHLYYFQYLVSISRTKSKPLKDEGASVMYCQLSCVGWLETNIINNRNNLEVWASNCGPSTQLISNEDLPDLEDASEL